MSEPLIVWVVTAFTAEPYECATWIDSVHLSKEAAEKHIYMQGEQPINEDRANHDWGHFLHDPEQYEVKE